MAATMTDEDRFYHELRLMQRRTKCSDYVCQQFVKVYKNHGHEEAGARGILSFDRKAKKAAGVNYIVLHGCPECNKYIYKPDDQHVNCPYKKDDGTICGHPRFNTDKQPFEVRAILVSY